MNNLLAKQQTLGFDPWVKKMPWRTAWQPTPVFLPGESHGQRSLEGLQSIGHDRQQQPTNIQFSSVAQLCPYLCDPMDGAACQASLSITISQSLFKVLSIESVMPSNHLILCRPLLLPSVFPIIRVFSNETVPRIRWQEYWSFSISPSNEYSELISFKMDWLDLLAVQGNLKGLLQHHSSKA